MRVQFKHQQETSTLHRRTVEILGVRTFLDMSSRPGTHTLSLELVDSSDLKGSNPEYRPKPMAPATFPFCNPKTVEVEEGWCRAPVRCEVWSQYSPSYDTNKSAAEVYCEASTAASFSSFTRSLLEVDHTCRHYLTLSALVKWWKQK